MSQAIRRLSCLASLILAGALLAGAQLLPDSSPEPKPRPKPQPKPSATLKVTTDLECDWTLDAAPQGRLKFGEIKIVRVSPGDYLVRATSADGQDSWQSPVTIHQSEQKLLQIQLSSVRQAREKETAERKLAEERKEEARKQEEARKREEEKRREEERKKSEAKQAILAGLTGEWNCRQGCNSASVSLFQGSFSAILSTGLTFKGTFNEFALEGVANEQGFYDQKSACNIPAASHNFRGRVSEDGKTITLRTELNTYSTQYNTTPATLFTIARTTCTSFSVSNVNPVIVILSRGNYPYQPAPVEQEAPSQQPRRRGVYTYPPAPAAPAAPAAQQRR